MCNESMSYLFFPGGLSDFSWYNLVEVQKLNKFVRDLIYETGDPFPITSLPRRGVGVKARAKATRARGSRIRAPSIHS